MGWATSENRLKRLVEWLILTSGLTCVIASSIYLLVALLPVYYFHGYIQGYYSILDYRLYYLVDQQPVYMPHTDYIRHVSLSFTISSLTILVVSFLSIIYRKRLQLTAGLVSGCATALILLYGVFNGYIYRAMMMDLARFQSLIGDFITLRTLAGDITFIGIRLERTSVLGLALNNWLMLTLVATAITTSYASIMLVSMKLSKHILSHNTQYNKVRQGLVYAMIITLAFSSLASVFIYYPSTLTILPQPPPATLETLPYNYTCTALTRTSRGALTYTDFEEYPVSGWTSYGGVWGLSAGGGFKGNALRGRDNDGGVGRASQYYWNTRIDGYTSLWVSVKVRAETWDGYKGIGLLNADRSRLYEISVYASRAEVWKWDGGWRRIGSTSVPGYSATRWYTLVLNYNVTATAVSFALWIYDDTGALVATLTASDTGATRFTPAYAGVTIDAATDRWFRFDDFIVSTVDPRSLYFTGFYTGMRVEVWDNLGYLVNSTTAPASAFILNVTGDLVVGTGIDGKILVRYPDTYLCGGLSVPLDNAVLGGDVYALVTSSISINLGSNKTSANVSLRVSGASLFNTTTRFLRLNTTQVLYARLILDAFTTSYALNLDMWIEGITSSTNISIRNGVPVSTFTSIVQLNLGGNNFIALSGYFTAMNEMAVVKLKLELCTALGGQGACVYYPVELILSS
ncbi:MAG: hypothetical protein QXQ17_03680 [Desulfurococcaceae archaeon]